MFMDHARTFLFICNDCGTILSLRFEKQDEIKKVQEKRAIVDCPCGQICYVLFD